MASIEHQTRYRVRPSSLARFGHNIVRAHWKTAKRVLRYLEGTRGGVLHLVGKRCGSLAIRTQIGGAIVMITDRSVHTLSRLEMELSVGSQRSNLA